MYCVNFIAVPCSTRCEEPNKLSLQREKEKGKKEEEEKSSVEIRRLLLIPFSKRAVRTANHSRNDDDKKSGPLSEKWCAAKQGKKRRKNKQTNKEVRFGKEKTFTNSILEYKRTRISLFIF